MLITSSGNNFDSSLDDDAIDPKLTFAVRRITEKIVGRQLNEPPDTFYSKLEVR